jgi:hypothetical protein
MLMDGLPVVAKCPSAAGHVKNEGGAGRGNLSTDVEREIRRHGVGRRRARIVPVIVQGLKAKNDAAAVGYVVIVVVTPTVAAEPYESPPDRSRAAFVLARRSRRMRASFKGSSLPLAGR